MNGRWIDRKQVTQIGVDEDEEEYPKNCWFNCPKAVLYIEVLELKTIWTGWMEKGMQIKLISPPNGELRTYNDHLISFMGQLKVDMWSRLVHTTQNNNTKIMCCELFPGVRRRSWKLVSITGPICI